MSTGHPTPPPGPSRNDTGVVPRWHVAAAAAAGLVAGRCGVVALVLAVMAATAVVHLLGELLSQARRGEFRREYSIAEHEQMCRALRDRPSRRC